MNYRPYESELARSYDDGASQYRRDDEVEARSENHRRLGGNLRRICRSFAHPIRVLEIGCGTGRYFHWLENVEELIGTDISPAMLQQAERPVFAEKITVKKIRLMRGSIYDMTFNPGSFDFIYSLGVFGYGAAITPELARSVHAWLAPGGWVYFDAIEVPHRRSLRERIREAVYPWLPKFVRDPWEARQTVPVIRHSRDVVQRVMQDAGFTDFVLATTACHSPLWNGVHLECSACKSEKLTPRARRMDLEFTEPTPARAA
jgi:SAM-dependent methyltransferase